MTDLITERSVKFIDQHAAAPFFLEVTYNATHWPFQVPDHPSVGAENGRFVQPHEPGMFDKSLPASLLIRTAAMTRSAMTPECRCPGCGCTTTAVIERRVRRGAQSRGWLNIVREPTDRSSTP